MSRTLRIFMVAACTLAIVGVGTAMACDSAKNASAEKANSGCSSSAKMASAEKAAPVEKASSSSCSASAKKANASMASAGNCAAKKAEMANAGNYGCSTSAMAACLAQAKCDTQGSCTKTAMAMANYEPFTFVKQADTKKVAVGVSTTKDGFAFVFAGLTADDVIIAKKLAADGVASMNAPAHCEMTRGAMAQKANGGCEATKATTEACLKALADAEIVLTETEQGAVAAITSKDEAKVQQLHALLAQVQETDAAGSE